MIDLKAIKARLAAATPGPWIMYRPRVHTAIIATDEADYITNWVAERVREPGDAELIAHAPADIAAMIAEIETLRSAAEARA